MKKLKLFSLFALLGLLLFSCSKEEIDQLALTDFPPGIISISPADGAKVVKGDFDIVVTFADGTVSPLKSASVTLNDPSGSEITSASSELSGIEDELRIPGADFGAADLELGIYSMEISVTDQKDQTAVTNTTFEISNLPFAANNEEMYFAGSYNGWGADEFTLVAPFTWQLNEVELDGGEWKLKNCADWCDKDWADPDCDGFVEETTGGGPNGACSPTGLYNVVYNDQTGLISFVSSITFDQNITDLYLLGTFNNFQGEDYHFNQIDNNLWKLNEVELSTGDQFRFSEGPVFMGKNFGDNEPDGIADEYGLNIIFDEPEGSAFYNVVFNDKTLAYGYEFVRYPSIGIIGDATPGGWDTDTDMTDKGDGTFEIFIELTDGEVKFRANDSWDLNWGGTDFPEGIAEVNSPNNIPVEAGTYTVTFNPTTLEYKFVAGDLNLGIIGDATPGGWDVDTDLHPREDGKYCIVMELTDGSVKFRQDDGWDINWGGTDFPSGTAVFNSPDNIPVTAGLYTITFDPSTLEYNFGPGPQTIGILGDATPGGWDTDQDLTPNGDGTYSIVMDLTDGEVKFRADDAWDLNWGGLDFPEGVGEINSPNNIPVVAGTYSITFNPCTGEYKFGSAYTNIGIIGDATTGGWDTDTDMTDDDGDGTFTIMIGLADGSVKFRADDGWDDNWGGTAFPEGVGEFNSPDNIPVTAGVYMVSFNPSTGVYKFEEMSIGILGDATAGGWDVDEDLTASTTIPGELSIAIDLTDGAVKFRANDGWDINWGGTGFPTGVAEFNSPDNIPVTAGSYTVKFNINTLEYSFE